MAKGKIVQKSDKIYVMFLVFFLSFTIVLSGCVNTETEIKKPVDSAITGEDAIRIVINDPAVTRWIDNNTYEIQEVHQDVTNISPTETQKSWTVIVLMKNNQSVNHWILRVLMNGTVQNVGYPTYIPLQLNREEGSR